MALTGRFNLRKSLSGRIILQVEEEVESAWGFFSRRKLRRRWRDAKPMDLPATELRALMDLRNRPRFSAQAFEPTLTMRPTSGQTEERMPMPSDPASQDEAKALTAH